MQMSKTVITHGHPEKHLPKVSSGICVWAHAESIKSCVLLGTQGSWLTCVLKAFCYILSRRRSEVVAVRSVTGHAGGNPRLQG